MSAPQKADVTLFSFFFLNALITLLSGITFLIIHGIYALWPYKFFVTLVHSFITLQTNSSYLLLDTSPQVNLSHGPLSYSTLGMPPTCPSIISCHLS